jgi:hypothetical protein
MSDMNLRYTMNRIKSAAVDSRIAVFKSDKAGMVRTVFASTLESMDMIRVNPDLVGVFDGTMDQKLIRGIIAGNITQEFEKTA